MQLRLQVTKILMDGQFEPARGDLASMGILLSATSAGERVPKTERRTHAVNERVRSECNSLPFKKVPAVMITKMVASSALWLSSFPQVGRAPQMTSPQGVVVGSNMDYLKHCCKELRERVQTHEEHDNSMATHASHWSAGTRPHGERPRGALLREPDHRLAGD